MEVRYAANISDAQQHIARGIHHLSGGIVEIKCASFQNTKMTSRPTDELTESRTLITSKDLLVRNTAL
jgi:hypothetical protein